jgi:aminoglycoside phosphotransferase (APT) family kinase protein
MHAGEVETDAALVRRLLAAQFPRWAGLTVEPVPSAGTDNALYRLGPDMAVRLPRIDWAVEQVEKEHRWLPRLAQHLPLAIPTPLAMGEPGEGYPWHWSIYRWLEGENAEIGCLADPRRAALDLAGFIAALHRIDATNGPRPNAHGLTRGNPVGMRDRFTREAIRALGDAIDANAVTAVWDAALRAPAWDRPPVWLHGDLQSGNLLAANGRLSAVIDFGCLAVGDPAYDVMTAWLYLPAEVRGDFRGALTVDAATWTRARGLALSVGLIALPYYRETNATLAGIARRAIDAAVAD